MTTQNNFVFDLQKYVCDALNASEYLQNLSVSFVAENARDIEFQIANALKKQGIAAVVTTPTMVYQGHDGADTAWQAEVQLVISEYVPINRARNKTTYATALDIASFCQDELAGPQGCCYGKFCPKEIRQSEENNLLVCTSTFDTVALTELSGKFDWDGTHVVISPYASQADLDELSSQVQDISAQISSLSPFDPSVLSAYETKEEAAIEHTALSSAISSAVYEIETQLTSYETKQEATTEHTALSVAISAAVQEIESVDNKLSAYLPLAGGRMTGPVTGVDGRSSFSDGFFAMSEDQYKRANLENGTLTLTDEDASVPYDATKSINLQAGIGGEISSLYDVLEDKIGDIESIIDSI